MKKITLVIPIYMVENYLEECLESVVNQTFTDFLCILVNDGSTDSSGQIAERYVEKYPEIFKIINQENKGLSGARNSGIEITETEYIAFLDSDDIAMPDFLKDLYEAAVKENVDIVEGGFVKFYENGSTVNVDPVLKGKSLISENKNVICDFTVVAWNKLYKTSLFKDTGIRYPEGLIYEDTGTTPLLLARCNSVCSIHQPLIYYRQRKGSIMASPNKKVNHLYQIADIIRYDVALESFPEQRDAQVIFRIQSLIMKLCESSGTRKEILKAYTYLKNWKFDWYKNRVWKERFSNGFKSKLLRAIFVSKQVFLLRLIVKRKKNK
ncbi:MAG: glycosyltransferase [Clostridia bacterium]|nr:glycosyltransferase [Clostridia bacterium]